MNYEAFFKKLSNHEQPHRWQTELSADESCTNRLIGIPTGFGKTLGVFATWLWHSYIRARSDWPRRLIWCLPMRVLVEQTEQEIRHALKALGLLWDGKDDHSGKVGVHLLMGGEDSGQWHLYPEHHAVLIGTQDMLLSRAMNRGYASPRARWPMEFGLLNQDSLWVMDEVQLMDVGLATSAQLQTFRHDDSTAGRCLRPGFTWWMSATLQKEWLEKSPDTTEMMGSLSENSIKPMDRKGHLWDDVSKTCRIERPRPDKELAKLIVNEHGAAGFGASGITLVVLNTVDRAVSIYEALRKDKTLKDNKTDVRLVHSRFRPAEKAAWRKDFLNRDSCKAGTNRIIVATQVVEAGVDISATVLITELAPWASLVQRFGRCARWGGSAKVVVVDLMAGMAQVAIDQARNKYDKALEKGKKQPSLNEGDIIELIETKAAKPYGLDETRAARTPLEHLSDVTPVHLERFEEENTELLPHLYPFEPRHLLLRHELDELFDTTPDLSGSDIDISRFIRSGEERDLQVFWSEMGVDGPDSHLRPTREALCAVPFLKARDWLCGTQGNVRKNKMRAWVWDWLEGNWRYAEKRDFFPGQTILVAKECGGYNTLTGWKPDSKKAVRPVETVQPLLSELTDASQDNESMSSFQWQSIAVHGRQTGFLAKQLAKALAPDYADLFDLAGRWHDAGKAHPAFNNSIIDSDRPNRHDLAKAPRHAWLPVQQLYPMDGEKRRVGFRHELASVLCLMEVLKRRNPDHPALLGPWRSLLTETGTKPLPAASPDITPNALENEILALDAGTFNLAAFLICAHHGKVRMAWHACPADQAAGNERPRIRGLCDGDRLPQLPLFDADGQLHLLPEITIDLSPSKAGLNPRTGPSWTERVLTLFETYGPFTLAWFESLMRAADQRASAMEVKDELLEQEVKS